MTDAGLLEIADELYALGPAEFTAARDAKAKGLKGTELAQPVKALKKPTTAAWVVNLLVRREAAQVEQMLEVGAALREAQAAMSGEELRELTRQRRQLTSAIATRARQLAAEAGVKVTSAVGDQVEATLTAAMVDEECARALRSGLLVGTFTSTGIDEVDVASAVATPDALGFVASQQSEPEPARPDLHVVPDLDGAERERAEEALAETESALAKAQREHGAATGEVEQLQAHGLQLQAEIDELRRKLADLESAYEENDDELADAEEVRSEAESTLAEATRARDRAQAALDRLD